MTRDQQELRSSRSVSWAMEDDIKAGGVALRSPFSTDGSNTLRTTTTTTIKRLRPVVVAPTHPPSRSRIRSERCLPSSPLVETVSKSDLLEGALVVLVILFVVWQCLKQHRQKKREAREARARAEGADRERQQQQHVERRRLQRDSQRRDAHRRINEQQRQRINEQRQRHIEHELQQEQAYIEQWRQQQQRQQYRRQDEPEEQPQQRPRRDYQSDVVVGGSGSDTFEEDQLLTVERDMAMAKLRRIMYLVNFQQESVVTVRIWKKGHFFVCLFEM
jgi:flagellar biosynthesis GTPase FlhF